MDKINCIRAFILTNSGEEIYFYLRLDQIIAVGYANDPKYKDNYFMVITNYNGYGDEYFKPFYYVHKDIIHKYFNLEEMPADGIKPVSNGCGFDEASDYSLYLNR